ncbi:MAG: leucine-rich repeat domain-containing protein [Oscillospiraceae bacterium]|nr:leucine-rich repeat domain-containing protein [Oscillospiraceae bacterium]
MRKLLIMIALCSVGFCGCQSVPQEDTGDIQAETQENQEIQETINSEEYPTSKPPAETIVPNALDIDAGATPLEQFQYEIHTDGTAVILDFIGSDTELVITSQIGGYPVTEIAQYAFEASWNVTSITLPDTIEVINEQAFADCESLTKINIPEQVKSIKRGAFSNCMNLTELTLPAGLAETQEEMLTNCLALQDLSVLNASLNYNNWGLEDLETKCTIHAPAGAEILTWAEENDFPIVIE